MAAESIAVFEVGPRDGLQNEPLQLPLETKIEFIERLAAAGAGDLEIGSFVRPDRVPQMASTDELFRKIHAGEINIGKARAWSLVPNITGLERAMAGHCQYVALSTAATDSFAQKNIGMSIKQSITKFTEIVKRVREVEGNSIRIRGYVSTAFGCPFEGKVAPKKVLEVVESLAKVGVDEISIADTIGVGTPNQVDEVLKPAMQIFKPESVAGHFHDTRGTALANALRSIEIGVRTLDSSAGGLGGCPFAPGAAGNLATEDLVYMLHGMGFQTGINLEALAQTSLWLAQRMNRPLSSKFLQSFASECQTTRK